MLQLVNGLGALLLAESAGEGGFAFRFLGGFLGYLALIPGVARGIHIVILIGEAAGAGVGSKAFLIAGGGSHRGGILMGMLNFINGFGTLFLAAGAGVGGFALGFLGGFFGYSAAVPAVAKFRGIIRLVTVSTNAGKNGITLLGTGRSYSRSGIGVDRFYRHFTGTDKIQLISVSGHKEIADTSVRHLQFFRTGDVVGFLIGGDYLIVLGGGRCFVALELVVCRNRYIIFTVGRSHNRKAVCIIWGLGRISIVRPQISNNFRAAHFHAVGIYIGAGIILSGTILGRAVAIYIVNLGAADLIHQRHMAGKFGR